MTKANCKTCVCCVPNEQAHKKSIFSYPNDFECLMENDNFSDTAHMCNDYKYYVDEFSYDSA